MAVEIIDLILRPRFRHGRSKVQLFSLNGLRVPRLGPKVTAFFIGFMALSGCATTPDAMPSTQVDIFVLDLSTSNNKENQLRRLNEDLSKSLTSNGLGVPKATSNQTVSGPITTIFTFIEESATKSETFKIQNAESTIKLWNNEFAKDKDRNAYAWLQVSNSYSSYLQQQLSSNEPFSYSTCQNQLDLALSQKFNSDGKRTRIVNTLCQKIEELTSGYSNLIKYVENTEAPKTDIFGMLAKIDRMVEQIKKDSPQSEITVNIGSDMQHETGDSRDTPRKLTSIKLERDRACKLGGEDRIREGLTFDNNSVVRISGVGNAEVSAEFANALVRYWQCFFPKAEIR